MVVETETTVRQDILQITVNADYSLERLLNFIGHIKAEAVRTSMNKVFVDAHGLRGSMSEADRFLGGQRVAEVFGPALKVAILMPQGQVTKLGEMTAVNRGARLLVTEDETEARMWLAG